MPLQEPRERVLIVDDDSSITLLLSRILEAEGYRCMSVGTIGDAKMTLAVVGRLVHHCESSKPAPKTWP